MGERDTTRRSGNPNWLMRDPTIRLSALLINWTFGGLLRLTEFILRRRADRAHADIVARRARRVGKK